MGTCTFRPEVYAVMEAQAEAASRSLQKNWQNIEVTERFHFLQQEALQEVQRYWKRLRKYGLAFKYLAVFETDLAGRLHMHCLIHETDPFRPILKRELDDTWGLGFTKFTLLKWESEDRPPFSAITYVTKAIASHHQGRICASLDYSPRRNIPKTHRPEQLNLQLP